MYKGRRQSFRHAKRSRLFAEINVTPFVDVMLVLLVIFMVSAPMLAKQIGVNLPEVGGKDASMAKAPIVITVNNKGQISVDSKVIVIGELVNKLKALSVSTINHREAIWIRADKDVNYGTVAEIIELIQGAGFTNVSLASMSKKPAG